MDAVALTHLDTAARYPLRLCRSYRADRQRLTRITPGPPRGLRWQERLTGMLLRARPEYSDSERRLDKSTAKVAGCWPWLWSGW